MTWISEWPLILAGAFIFFARIIDVSMGTLRVLSTVQGRMGLAFALGLVEISLWLVVVSTVVIEVPQRPMLGIFYALGFSSGNVLGIWLEKRLALGTQTLRVFSSARGREIAAAVRGAGFALTTFQGEGLCGPVTELAIVCRRRDLPCIMQLVRQADPQAFHVTEPTGTVSRLLRPGNQQPTGWRSMLKKK